VLGILGFGSVSSALSGVLFELFLFLDHSQAAGVDYLASPRIYSVRAHCPFNMWLRNNSWFMYKWLIGRMGVHHPPI